MEILEFNLAKAEATPETQPTQIFELFVFEILETMKCWVWASIHSPKFNECFFGFTQVPIEWVMLHSSTNRFTVVGVTFHWKTLGFQFPSLVIDQYKVSNPQANIDLIWR